MVTGFIGFSTAASKNPFYHASNVKYYTYIVAINELYYQLKFMYLFLRHVVY
jgi:hypothetical protein